MREARDSREARDAGKAFRNNGVQDSCEEGTKGKERRGVQRCKRSRETGDANIANLEGRKLSQS
jgi:hypothetical protein